MDTILNSAVVSIIGLLVGIIVTVVVARYYFLQTVEKSKKSLTPYIDFFSELFDGIDPDVRKTLSIKYQDLEVEDLIEVQYLVANSGEKPIRDLIKPLTLSIPGSSKIMNVALLYISPEGREVSLIIDKDNNTIEFLFDLLNKDEFFVVKLLLSGKVDVNDFKFTITVDDLPPVLETKPFPYDIVEVEDVAKVSKIEWWLILAGAGFLFLGTSVGYLALNVTEKLPDSSGKSMLIYISEVPLIWVAQWPALIVSGLVLLIGIGMMIGGVSDVRFFNKKKKLKLPVGVIRSKSLFDVGFEHEERENEKASKGKE